MENYRFLPTTVCQRVFTNFILKPKLPVVNSNITVSVCLRLTKYRHTDRLKLKVLLWSWFPKCNSCALYW